LLFLIIVHLFGSDGIGKVILEFMLIACVFYLWRRSVCFTVG